MDQAIVNASFLGLIVIFVFIKIYVVPVVKPLMLATHDDVEDEEQDDEQAADDEEADDELAVDEQATHDNDEEADELADDELADDEQDEVTDMDIDEDDVYADMPELEGRLPPLEDLTNYVSQETFTNVMERMESTEKENATTILTKIDEFQSAMGNQIMTALLKQETQFSEKLETLQKSIVPLLAKKELDLTHYQGWTGKASIDDLLLEISIHNTNWATFEENDAWVDQIHSTVDSVLYRNSLLGLDDSVTWTISRNETSATLTKRYTTLGWNNSINIDVTLRNLGMINMPDSSLQMSAMATLKKLNSTPNLIDWKRVLHTKSA